MKRIVISLIFGLAILNSIVRADQDLDSSTHANLDQIIQTSMHLDLLVQFSSQTVSGKTSIDFTVLATTKTIILDVNKITIYSVVDIKSGNLLTFEIISEIDSQIGDSLKITLLRNYNVGEKISLDIYYSASKTADSNQWLTKEMTFGKKNPFYYTQNEPIYARSIVPCQDTPAVKLYIKATITTDLTNLTILFGGTKIGNDVINKDGTKTAVFEQKNPIPTYLIAIAIGDLTYKVIADSPVQVRVWAEPSQIIGAANEFKDIKLFIEKANEYSDHLYDWGFYDVLVLPPAFPFGGMENPNLTFVSPSVISGDGSLVNVLAHELAHSWTGNLITNQNWDNFWLNEGFTVFFERKIIQLARENGDQIRLISSESGYAELERNMNELYNAKKEDGSPDERYQKYTHLNPQVGKYNPDDSSTLVPYEKGYGLLYWLESLIGSDKFKTIFNSHIVKFKFSTATADKFKDQVLIPGIETLFKDDNTKLQELKNLIQEKWDKWMNNDLWNDLPVNDFSKNLYINITKPTNLVMMFTNNSRFLKMIALMKKALAKNFLHGFLLKRSYSFKS